VAHALACCGGLQPDVVQRGLKAAPAR